jgi:FkbM family methyltransferase
MSVNIQFANIFYNYQKTYNPKATIEIGAHHAEFSLQMKNYFDIKNIWAIEANPMVYKKFKKLCSSINYVNLAISDKNGYTKLNLVDEPDNPQYWHTLTSSILNRIDDLKTNGIKVQTLTLDTFVKDNNISGPISLWIDVEGANKEVLLGSTETLKNVISIYIEVETSAIWDKQWIKKDVVIFLKNNGFMLAEESGFTGSQQQDLIFIRS